LPAAAKTPASNSNFSCISSKALIAVPISANQVSAVGHAPAFFGFETEYGRLVRAPFSRRVENKRDIMIHSKTSVRARTVCGVFATILATTILAATATFDASAQTPPATQRPAAAPKKPPVKPPVQPQQKPPEAPPQQQAQQTPPVVVPQLIYRRWTKVCPPKDAPANAGGKQPCFIFTEGREDAGGALVVRATIMEVEGEPKKGLVVSFIYGVDLIRGTHIVVDQGPLEATAPYVVCVPPNVPPPLFGCVSQYEITGEVINGLKKGKMLTLQTVFNGQTLSPQLPLNDFAKAYDGPPTDLKAEAEQEQKLQDALRERAKKKEEELTKKSAVPGKP
jgi:invasion protein IalB